MERFGEIMKMKISVLFFAAALVVVVTGSAFAEDPLVEKLKQKGILTEEEASQIQKEASKQEVKLPKGLEGISIGALGYIDYSAGKSLSSGRHGSYNRFALTRGYINIAKKLTPWLSVRMTPDVFQESKDTAASDYGSWLLRFKYYYAQFSLPDMAFFTNNKSELGMGHMAWLDFQEHVNPYRCQGTMFQERFGTFNSSDLGVGIMGYLGGEISEEYQKNVTKYYAGKYGSYHLGLYNGAGYHAAENNDNKVVEYRLTVRPLPNVLPGLQLTYFGLTGKGNAATNPDWQVNTGFVSYEAPMYTLTAEAIRNTGNQAGTWLKTGTTDSKDTDGYSFFGFVRIPRMGKLRAFARYDYFDPDDEVSDDEAKLYIAGLSYDVFKHNMAILDYERFEYGNNNPKVSGSATAADYEDKIQFVYQISF